MNAATRIATAIAAIILVVAGLAWGRYLQRARDINGGRRDVLEVPIRLEQGFSISQAFTVDIKTMYGLNLECQNGASLDALNAETLKELALDVSITSNSVVVARGDSIQPDRSSHTNDYISRRLSTFEGYPGTRYEMNVRLVRCAPVLATRRATIKVSVDPGSLKNALVALSVSAYQSLGLTLIGLLCLRPLLTYLVSRLYRSKT